MKLINGKVVRGKQNTTNDNQVLPPEPKKKKKNQRSSISMNGNILIYLLLMISNLPIPALDSHEPPSSLSEKFLANDILQLICNEFVRYAQNKGNHSYKLQLHNLKGFIAILLISGYVGLPRRPMFWEYSADVHNDAVSSMMSRNRFDEIMKYLHLADNTSLDPNDKFTQ